MCLRWCYTVICHGYYLPLMENSVCVNFKNYLTRSAMDNQIFVETAITDLLRAGSVCKVRQQDTCIVICSPLGVVLKKNGSFI